MASTTDPAEQAAALVDTPALYEQFADEYSDEVSFYSALRGSAQQSLSFDEYVALRRVFLNRGPTEAIRNRLEDRLDRSLKNMVLDASPRGRAYSVDTLRELESRRKRFDGLDIETPSLETVVQTTIEHLYDEVAQPTETRSTLERLLAELPANRRDAVECVARARLTETVLSEQEPSRRVESALDTYIETVPSPESVADRTDAEAYVTAARKRAFADPEKRRLYERALHAAPTVERLREFLYLTGAEAVEAYRHGNGSVTRADFILARRHLRMLREIRPDTQSTVRTGYVDSYWHLARAIEAGGGRWLSARAGKPDVQWQMVATAYARAATAVRPASPVRFIKYLSKALRHAAHALSDWESKHRLHVTARRNFERLDPETVAQADDDETVTDVATALTGTIHTHRCREYEARAHIYLAMLAYDDARWAVSQARTEAAKAPQRALVRQDLDAINQLARARQAERHGSFAEARDAYDSVEATDDAFQVGVIAHERLCEVKELLDAGDTVAALSAAHDFFGSESVIVAATEAYCGLQPDADRDTLRISDQFISLDSDTVPVLLALVRLSTVGGPAAADIRRQLLDCLLAL